jgi:uncharacterized metal-binding protein YceD (DUF177 family)
MTDSSSDPQILRICDLAPNTPYRFNLSPDAPARAGLAQELGISGIRKLSFQGVLQADGRSDWLLEAKLGATVVQPCVVTLEPVVSRIDQPVLYRFTADFVLPEEGEETEMSQDETLEPLPDEIDLNRIMSEALALALPDYPRSVGATLETDSFAPPGVKPLTDDDTKPFAGLAGLRDKLDESK